MPSKLKHRQRFLNLGLLAVVVLLGITVWSASRPGKPEGHDLIPGFKAALIREIHLNELNKPPVILIAHQDSWYINGSLIKARANPLLIQALLTLPQQRTVHRYSIQGLKLGKYGLNPPAVTIEYGDGKQIGLGRINPIEHLQYARVTNHVYLIRNALAGLNLSSSLSWVSLTLLPPQSHIEEINLPDLSVKKIHPGKWLISPRPRNFKSNQAQTLFQAWSSISAFRVTTSPGKTLHSAHKASRQIRITLKNGKIYTFKIISTTPDLVLRRIDSGIDYHFPATTGRILLTLGEKKTNPINRAKQ